MQWIEHSPRHRWSRVAFELFRRKAATSALQDEASATGFDRAIDHFEHGRWSEAYDALVPLADSGDREAARIALLMTTRGRRLFGETFAASPSQRERWREASSRAVQT